MALGSDNPPTPPRPPQRSTARLVLAGVLLLIPVIALMAVPTYAKTDPTLWGFPFFFWYQFAWVIGCSAFTYAAYRLTLGGDRKDGER